jgi:large subunit ribosomal protein L21
MYAIIEESGGQRKVSQGDTIQIDLHASGETAPGTTIRFDKVLVVGEVGGNAKIGAPYVSNAHVEAKVVESLVKGEKLYIHKFREKKTWRKKTGHRQKYTLVEITSIKG